ncbi:MAG: lipase family protein [Pseudomonas sp.]
MDRLTAAPYALLVMYAWDMCDINPRQIPPRLDPRIAEAGWTIVGFISGSDDIVVSGLRLRSAMLSASTDERNRVCYGYVAQREGECVAVIRGTDGAQEWGDDLVFLMTDHPHAGAGLVDQGFWDIYRTLQFHGLAGEAPVPITAGIVKATGDSPLMVLGHSLGSSLATYLTLDLNLAKCHASACLFASPRTGNQTFVDFFEATVSNYDVFNYERDLVPTVPKSDVLHLSRYYPLKQAKTIPVDPSGPRISNNPLCNHHLICYTALLDSNLYEQAIADPHCTVDDHQCAACVLQV